MRSLLTVTCVALTLAGCSDTFTQRGVDPPDDPTTSGTENDGRDPSAGDGSTTAGGMGGEGADVDGTDGIRREGDTVVRESDGFVFDPNDVKHYLDDTNNPYPESTRDFTCAYAATSSNFALVYVTQRECIEQSREAQCDLTPQDVSIPHCTLRGVIVSSINGMPEDGTEVTFLDALNLRTLEPHVDDIIMATFYDIRGHHILGASSHVAPPTEFQGMYPDGFPIKNTALPQDLDEQSELILGSDCPRVTKEHLERIEEYFFARSQECGE